MILLKMKTEKFSYKLTSELIKFPTRKKGETAQIW